MALATVTKRLYHGTHQRNVDSIRQDGLRRGIDDDWQILAEDYDFAMEVGRARFGDSAVVLTFDVPTSYLATRYAGDVLNGHHVTWATNADLPPDAMVGAAPRTSALDNEARISVAEQVMERAGLAGDVILVPVGRVGDEAYESSMEPLRMWVRDLCRTNINFYASDYILNTDGGGAQALTDGMNRIVVRPITNTMTILHEVAHVLNRSSEGRGHDDQFITTLEGLYRKLLGAEAADTFIDLVRPD